MINITTPMCKPWCTILIYSALLLSGHCCVVKAAYSWSCSWKYPPVVNIPDGFFSFVEHLCTEHAQRVCQSYVCRMYVEITLDNSIQLRCTKQWLVALVYCMLNLFLMQIQAFILHPYSMTMQDIFRFGHYSHSTWRNDNATKHVLMLECADLSRY